MNLTEYLESKIGIVFAVAINDNHSVKRNCIIAGCVLCIEAKEGENALTLFLSHYTVEFKKRSKHFTIILNSKYAAIPKKYHLKSNLEQETEQFYFAISTAMTSFELFEPKQAIFNVEFIGRQDLVQAKIVFYEDNFEVQTDQGQILQKYYYSSDLICYSTPIDPLELIIAKEKYDIFSFICSDMSQLCEIMVLANSRRPHKYFDENKKKNSGQKTILQRQFDSLMSWEKKNKSAMKHTKRAGFRALYDVTPVEYYNGTNAQPPSTSTEKGIPISPLRGYDFDREMEMRLSKVTEDPDYQAAKATQEKYLTEKPETPSNTPQNQPVKSIDEIKVPLDEDQGPVIKENENLSNLFKPNSPMSSYQQKSLATQKTLPEVILHLQKAGMRMNKQSSIQVPKTYTNIDNYFFTSLVTAKPHDFPSYMATALLHGCKNIPKLYEALCNIPFQIGDVRQTLLARPFNDFNEACYFIVEMTNKMLFKYFILALEPEIKFKRENYRADSLIRIPGFCTQLSSIQCPQLTPIFNPSPPKIYYEHSFAICLQDATDQFASSPFTYLDAPMDTENPFYLIIENIMNYINPSRIPLDKIWNQIDNFITEDMAYLTIEDQGVRVVAYILGMLSKERLAKWMFFGWTKLKILLKLNKSDKSCLYMFAALVDTEKIMRLIVNQDNILDLASKVYPVLQKNFSISC
ncbi:hypothetical protein TVAG_136490 [Trichomonas vaginalis G3]|uniref:Uncharacterized protein n=1 Tax=Trichomonas vaginalis (strain ATCC PRA-98 / G3) TaxID=412133 RepID=A2DJD1_TRIV3|nr:hypothetical protein TVAGG3_0543400 [Trichomonas vaginalis G3]EAY19518.1 hypothetical protein TVAG_136490 [Trichomonas vaginalis G3]KAI5520000.1 hypothetical protein TVAGG3_0543400 [Trichomonas vaginalis G3]|eukprot:XP_001580504.1 hypothetical protein [Trichomonas vaginalis G3]